MAPPFVLEQPKPYNRLSYRTHRILYTKGEYAPKVKVSDWEVYSGCLPYDHDPYDPCKKNLFLSHYDTLGQNTKTTYQSTTKTATEQIYNKELHHRNIINPKMLNFYSFSDTCIEPKSFGELDVCVDYTTTMQSSYTMPYPYKMQRLGIPKIPYLLYERLKRDEPEMSPTKFQDDNFLEVTRNMQKVKKGQWAAYDPITGEQTKNTKIGGTL